MMKVLEKSMNLGLEFSMNPVYDRNVLWYPAPDHGPSGPWGV